MYVWESLYLGKQQDFVSYITKNPSSKNMKIDQVKTNICKNWIIQGQNILLEFFYLCYLVYKHKYVLN